MNDLDDLETFGEVFSAILADRQIKSDEFLARKAMRSQDPKQRRINVQRKTINNWRNGRSRPRSLSDAQFQLILDALEIRDRELSVLSKFFEEPPVAQETVSPVLQENVVPKKHVPPAIWLALGSIVLIVAAIAIFFSIRAAQAPQASGYFAEIPEGELNLSKDGFVLAQSDREILSQDDLADLSGWELYVARNEIFARKGRGFWLTSSVCLQSHFDSMAKSTTNPDGWYEKKPRMSDLTNIEAANASTIRSYECQVRGGVFKCNGRLNICE